MKMMAPKVVTLEYDDAEFDFRQPNAKEYSLIVTHDDVYERGKCILGLLVDVRNVENGNGAMSKDDFIAAVDTMPGHIFLEVAAQGWITISKKDLEEGEISPGDAKGD